jgi:hypothetical protein
MKRWLEGIENNAPNTICKVLVGDECDKLDRKMSE